MWHDAIRYVTIRCDAIWYDIYNVYNNRSLLWISTLCAGGWSIVAGDVSIAIHHTTGIGGKKIGSALYWYDILPFYVHSGSYCMVGSVVLDYMRTLLPEAGISGRDK